jgi:hypothetical protein
MTDPREVKEMVVDTRNCTFAFFGDNPAQSQQTAAEYVANEQPCCARLPPALMVMWNK